jgi:polyhydroxybutyrate depolymerase
MTFLRLAAIAAVFGIVGSAGAAIAPGNYVRTLTFEGLQRTYRLHVPPSYDGSTTVPLVLNIHGLGSNAVEQEAVAKIIKISDASGFIAVSPNGINNAWNAGICCGNPDLDDVAFLRTVVEDVAGQTRIDRARIYVTGLSNGGAMSQRLACDAADLFAASAPLAFPIPLKPVTQCQPSRPIPVMTSMGLTDVLVSYTGGAFPSAADTFAQWKAVNGCTSAQPDVTEVFGASRCETYTQCEAGVETALCSITAKTFAPGSLINGHILYINDDVDIAQRAWDFLSRFTLPDPPAQAVVAGNLLVRSKPDKGRMAVAWNVVLGHDAWTAADGEGRVYGGTAKRKGKSKTFALTPTDDTRITLAEVISAGLGAPAGEVTIDPRDALRVDTDKTGTPIRMKGTLRLLRGGKAAGHVTLKVKQ